MVDIAPSLARALVTDVIVAREQLSECDDLVRRRNLIRASFAAIEGLVWLLRDHVLAVGTSLESFSPTQMLALRDAGYSVSENGVLRSTPQYLPLKHAIRYAIRCAQDIAPDIAVDYGGGGWPSMVAAINVRHRITHPKAINDLVIGQEDLDATSSALGWLLAIVEETMQATNAALKTFNEQSRDLLAALKRGDPEALDLYHKQLLRNDDDPTTLNDSAT